jgi:hypothetical protein
MKPAWVSASVDPELVGSVKAALMAGGRVEKTDKGFLIARLPRTLWGSKSGIKKVRTGKNYVDAEES